MRWFWFIALVILAGLLALTLHQPLILISIVFIVDMLITRKINWFWWIPKGIGKLPGWINLMLWVIFCATFLRLMVFDSLTVTSPGMRPVMQTGDNLIISKIHFGPRLPVTPVNVPFSHHYFPLSRCTPSYIGSITLPVRRLKGFTKLHRGDLIAYNFPEGDSTICGVELISYYALRRRKEADGDTISKTFLQYRPLDRREPEVSRCIGLPGDTLSIRSSIVKIGASTYEVKSSIGFDYLLEVDKQHLPHDVIDKLDLDQSEVQIFPGLGYLLPLRPEQLTTMRQRPEITGLSPFQIEPGKGDYNIFPHTPVFPWNRDNFGPVIVPKKDDSIILTLQNLPIYRRIIEVYEKNMIEIKEGQIFINKKATLKYVFKQNYYFVIGDNRHHSRDSRHWGFLPEDHIIGKPILIWFSASKSPGHPLTINWKRILKTPV